MSLIFLRTNTVLLFLLISLTTLAQKNTIKLQTAYENSEWYKVISTLSEKEKLKLKLNSTELELLVKSYGDSASFLQINGIEGYENMYQKAYQFGVPKNTYLKDDKAKFAKAIGYFCNNEYPQAKTILTDLLKKSPQNPEYHYWFWSVDVSNGNTNTFNHPNLLKGLELDPNNEDLLLNLGMLEYNSKEYAKGITTLLKCIDAKDDFYQRYYLGCIYSQLQNWDKAIENLSICIKQRPDFAIAYYVLGSIEIYNGNVKDAVSNFKETIKLAPNYYSYVENMKQYYPVLKEYDFMKKVQIRPSVDLLNKAVNYSNEGKYAKSISLIDKAIIEFNKETPIDTAYLLSAYNWQVVNANSIRNYEYSNRLAKQLLTLTDKNNYPKNERSKYYAYLASNYHLLGDDFKALKYAISSYQLIQKQESAKNYLLPSAINIAFLAYESEQNDYCKSYIEEASNIQKNQLFNLEDAMTLLEIKVKLNVRLKEYKSALSEIDYAEKNYDFSTAPNHERVLNELRFKVYIQNHQLEKATATLKTLEKDTKSKNILKFYYTNLIAEDLADYWVRMNKNNNAYQVLRAKIDEISNEMFLNFPLMNETGKSLNFTKNNQWLAKYFSYLYLNQEEKLGKNKIIYGASTSQFFKNAIINNNNKLFRLINDQQDETALAYLETLKTIKEKLRNENLSEDDRKSYLANEKQIKDYMLQRYNVKMHESLSNSNDFVEQLPENDVIVNIAKFDFYDFDNSEFHKDSVLYAYIILGKKRETEIRFISNGLSLENKWYTSYQNHIKLKIKDQQSYKQFFSPIEDLINQEGKIWLIADGVYHFINPNSVYNPTSDKYLLESSNIQIINKFETNTLTQKASNFSTATIIGNPNFNESKTEISSALKKLNYDEFISEAPLYAYHSVTRSGNSKVSPLPGTQKEIDNIKNTLESNGIRVNSFTGDDALEPIIKDKMDGSLLHFATHGIFENSENSLNGALNAGLLLSGANSHLEDPNNDGFLNTKEIENLLLHKTDLLVLSACETGQGKAKDGQGVFGLQRAFINAGVNELVMSLWKVDDKATSLLMSYFYENLFNEKSTEDAFRLAQLKLKEKYPEPYYWGAFILVK